MTNIEPRQNRSMAYRAARKIYRIAYRKPKAFAGRCIRGTRTYYYLKKRLPHLYSEYSKQPVEHKIVFMELRVSEMSNNFRYMYDRLREKYDYDIRVHYLHTGFISQKERFRLCESYIKDIATAEIVFVNEANNLLCDIDLRPETEYVQLWHGCGAFKRFGYSTVDMKFGGSKMMQDMYPMNTNYSLVTVSSPDVAWAYIEAMRLEKSPDIVKPLGISRTDVFYDEEYINRAKEKLHELIPGVGNRKIILYAPTFRGRVAKAKSPDVIDFRKFAEELSDEYVLLIKHHQVVKDPPQIPEEYEGFFAFDMTNQMEINELLTVADICISDYSSLVFEYSLMERPMVFFAYDLEDYCDWRGFYYDYDELVPGPVVRTNEELIDYIKNIENRFDRQRVADFRKKFMSACDGRSTDRILEQMFQQMDQKDHV